MPLPEDARAYAGRLIPDARPTLVISPCSSHALRNWRAERYAAVADYAARKHHMRVILCGGPSALERRHRRRDREGRASDDPHQPDRPGHPAGVAGAAGARHACLLSPDSGPAHMATMVRHAGGRALCRDESRAQRAVLSRLWCVDAYAQAARRFRGRAPEKLPWTEKIERAGRHGPHQRRAGHREARRVVTDTRS